MFLAAVIFQLHDFNSIPISFCSFELISFPFLSFNLSFSSNYGEAIFISVPVPIPL